MYQYIKLAVVWSLGRVRLSATPCSVDPQAPLSMGFSRQEYCSGLPCPPPGDLPDPGIEPSSPVSPALQADSLPSEPPERISPTKACCQKEGGLTGYFTRVSMTDPGCSHLSSMCLSLLVILKCEGTELKAKVSSASPGLA